MVTIKQSGLWNRKTTPDPPPPPPPASYEEVSIIDYQPLSPGLIAESNIEAHLMANPSEKFLDLENPGHFIVWVFLNSLAERCVNICCLTCIMIHMLYHPRVYCYALSSYVPYASQPLDSNVNPIINNTWALNGKAVIKSPHWYNAATGCRWQLFALLLLCKCAVFVTAIYINMGSVVDFPLVRTLCTILSFVLHHRDIKHELDTDLCIL